MGRIIMEQWISARGSGRRIRARGSLLATLLVVLLALPGCAARPLAVRPARALEIALAHPQVEAWYAAHSAPRVLEALNPAAARGLGRYRPAAMVDLADEGLLVRFDSALGPRPRRVEVIIDRESGAVLQIRQR